MGGNAIAQPQTAYNDTEVLTTAIEDLASTFCPAYFSENQIDRAGVTAYYYDYEGDNSCYSQVSYETAFCGMASRKNNGDLFKAGVANSCDNVEAKSMEYNPNDFKYICFAYLGHLHGGIDLNVYWSDIYGEDQYETKWIGVSGLGNSNGVWKYTCIDIATAYLQNEHNNGLINKVSVRKVSGDLYIDNVQIVKTMPSLGGEAPIDADLQMALSQRVVSVVPPTSLVSVNKTADWTETSKQYSVEFTPVNCAYDYPFISFYGLEASESGNTVTYTHSSWPNDASIVVERTQAATPPLSGSISLDYSSGPSKNSWAQPVILALGSDDANQLVQAYKRAGQVAVKVEMPTNECYSRTWDVTFLRPAGQHNTPVVDDSNAGGWEFTHTLNGVVQRGGVAAGGNAQAGLGAEWFASAHKGKKQVRVFVDGHAVVCEGYNTCNFDYDPSITPEITSVSESNNVITVAGTQLANANVVWPECTRTNDVTDETEIVCDIAATVAAGEYTVRVVHPSKGAATDSTSVNLVTVTNEATSILSQAGENKGSMLGGTRVTIAGSGFTSNTNVNFYNADDADTVPCDVDVDASTVTELVCVTNMPNDDFIDSQMGTYYGASSDKKALIEPGLSKEYQVLINSVDSGLTFWYSPAVTPVVESVTKVNNQDSNDLNTYGGDELSITGYGFVKASSFHVFIDGEEIFYGKSKVRDTSATLSAPALPHGDYSSKFQVSISSVGNAWNYQPENFHLNYVLEISSVSPNSGSINGGTLVTVSGNGFNDEDQIVIKVGDRECDTSCTDCSFAATQVVCRTPPAGQVHVFRPNYLTGNDFDWEENIDEVAVGDTLQFTWNFPEKMRNDKIKMTIYESQIGTNDMVENTEFNAGEATQTGSYSVVATAEGVLSFSTGCMQWSHGACKFELGGQVTVVARSASTAAVTVVSGDDIVEAGGNFNYQDAAVVDSVTVMGLDEDGNPVVSDDNSLPASTGTIVIGGTGFTSNHKVMLGDFECSVDSQSSTEITCYMDLSAEPTLYQWEELSVVDNNQGRAFMQFYRPINAILTADISEITPTTGSLSGGDVVTIRGAGLDMSALQVLFDGVDTCAILTQSYEQITCSAPVFNTGIHAEVQDRSISVQGTPNSSRKRRSTGAVQFNSNGATTDFTQDPSLTPTVNAMTAPANIETGSESFTFVISNYQDTNYEVMIGDAACDIDSANVNGNNLDVTCTLAESPRAGTASIMVKNTNGGAAFLDVSGGTDVIESINVLGAVTAVSPSEGSTLGGTEITITGRGFHDNTVPTINGVECQVADVNSNTKTSIVCVTQETGVGAYDIVVPNVAGSTVEYTFADSATPMLVSSANSEINAGDSIQFSGSNLQAGSLSDITLEIDGKECAVSANDATTITCNAPSLPGGDVGQITLHIDGLGIGLVDNIPLSYTFSISNVSPSTVTVSGGLEVTIYGAGFSETATVSVCDVTGIPINADTYTSDSISFIVPAAADQTQNSNCEVKVVNAPGKEKAWGNTLTYDFDSTPSVSSVSPVSGGSAGGTTLTVLGSGFTNDQKVSISGSECVIDAVTLGGGPNGEDKIVCVTEPWDMTTERRPLVRVYNDLGDAINTEHRFYYIDRWNSVYTWGGDEPPRKDEFVVIEAGKTVMIDGTTEDMKMLLVKGGTIIFDETQPCHLRAQNILITDGGIIQAGTKEEPYTGDLTIEMNGHLRSLELPVYGTKTLGVRDGTLELHGVPKVPTWTLLEETVQANSDTIVVQNPVNWVAGDRLVIATTSHLNSQNENEEVVIKSVSNDGRTITLETGVEFSHLGHTETLENGAVLEMRAEVGILSRNIKFRGSNNPEWNDVIEACPEGFDNGEFATQTCFQGRFGEEIGSDQFGAAIMLHPKHPGTEAEPSKAVARISHLEMNYVGQAFRLSRYPFHLHITGYNNETYFESSSIWQAFNRAFVLHHTDHVTFTNNVVYNVMGGAIFIENGIERFNKITYNFATFVRSSQALLNDDITPATIWITNPQNTVSHNHVGGSTHFGVWYRMRSHPEATSFTTSVCPDFAEMGEFKNNTMHSVGWFGLWVFENWFPHENGHNCQKGTIKPAVFENIRVWRAEKGAEFFKVGAMQARDWITAETRHVGIEFKEVTGPSWGDQTGIHDSTVAARTSLYNDVGGHDNAERAGIIIPAGSGMMIHNTDMIGWGLRDGSHGVTGTNIICRFDKGAGGYETRWSGIRWFNSPTRTLARWGNEFKIVDVDGTFTAADQVDNSLTTDLPTGGAAGVKLITETVGLTDGYGCVKQSGNLYSKKTAVTICPKDLGLNRWGMNTMQPASLDRQTIDFEFNGKNSSHAYRDLDPGETEGWHSVVPTGSNGEYHMYIPKSQGIRNISYAGSVRDLYPGEYIIMQNNVPEEPDEVHLNGVALRLEEPLTADSPHNSWYFDEATNTVSFMIKNTNTPSTRRRKRRGVQFGVQDEGIMNRHFNIFFRKCYWADCIEPPPAVRWDAPPTQRPENFLNTSMSNWQWNEESVDNDFGTMKVPGYISTSTRKRRNPQDLQDGDSLNIPNGQWVVLDRNFDVELDTILVQGGLEFGEGIDYLKVKRIIVLGGILIGTDQVGKQRTAPLEIDFVGTHDDRAIFLGQGNTFGSNGLACLGVCELLGAGPVNTWSKLSATANAGANSVSVEKDCSDWPAGSQVVVTTTSMDGSKTEIMTIASASANAVTFTSNLQYKHRGEATDGNDALIGEISLLSRNIHLHGAADEPEGFGMRIIGGEFSMRKYGSDKPALFSGQMNFEHIEISNYGQMQYYLDEDPRWGLVFQNADADNDDTVKQRVINSVLHHGYAGGIGIFSTDNVIVSGTTVHRAGHNGLKVVDSEGTQINDNICAVHYHIAAMSVFLTGEDKEVTEERWPACFDIEGAGSGVNNTFSGNRASGSGTIGIKGEGDTRILTKWD